MRRTGLFVLWSIVATICLCWLYVGGCGERRFLNDGNDPDTSSGEPKDYIVYFKDGGDWYSYYGYHVLTEQLDSLTLPARSIDMQITSDAKTMYISDTGHIAVIDIASKSITTTLPYRLGYYLALSPDDQYLAVMSDSLVILNTSDYSVIYSDTGEIHNGIFSADSKAFYGVEIVDLHFGDLHNIYRLDLTTSPFAVTRKKFTESLVQRIVPSADESLWYLMQDNSFAVYDVAADSLIFEDHLPAHPRRICVTPDERTVFYSYTPTFMNPFIPSSFRAYDVAGNRRLAEVDVFQIRESGDTTKFTVWDMVVTPDNRWLLCNSGDWGVGGGLIVLDVATLEITKHLPFPGIFVGDLVVQSSE